MQVQLIEDWERIRQEYLQKITNNKPKRLQHVIKQTGYPTKYYLTS